MENIVLRKYESAFEKVLGTILKNIEGSNWTLLAVHDLQKRLVARGFDSEPLTIIEICSAKLLGELIKDNKSIVSFLPCRIAVYEQDGSTYVSFQDPREILSNFGLIKKGQEIFDEIVKIL